MCLVSNSGTKAIGPATLTVFSFNGVPSTGNLSSLAPGATTFFQVSGSNTTGHCVVEGKGVSKSKTPVTLCRVAVSGGACLSAVTAR